MTADGEPAWGGTTLSIPQRRTLRAVAFAPAVRGFPGGIGDMAADLDDDLMPDEPSGDPGPLGDPGPPVAASPARRGQPPAPVPSVWQQSAAVWDEAGLAWQRPAAGDPGRRQR